MTSPDVRSPAGRTTWTITASALDGVVFDLDGVLTDTAALHEDAWARLARERLEGHRLTHQEYLELIDGRSRQDGVRALFAAHGRALDAGRLGELAAAKDGYFQDLLASVGPRPIAPSVDLVHRLRAAGFALAVVTASRSGAAVLSRAGIDGLFDVRVDGLTLQRLGLAGKPDPASLLEAARQLGRLPRRLAVVDDSRAGVAAGRAGGFGLVVGLDRGGGRAGLAGAGADVVVGDLATIHVEGDR